MFDSIYLYNIISVYTSIISNIIYTYTHTNLYIYTYIVYMFYMMLILFLPYNFYIFTPAGKHEHRHTQSVSICLGWLNSSNETVSGEQDLDFSVFCGLYTADVYRFLFKKEIPVTMKGMFFQIYQCLQWNCSKHCVYFSGVGPRRKRPWTYKDLTCALGADTPLTACHSECFAFCAGDKTDHSKGGLTSTPCNRCTCPSTWVRKCYQIPVLQVQMSGAQVCRPPMRVTGLLEFPFRSPRSWDANQGLRGHAMVSCTRAFVGVHPLWQGPWSTTGPNMELILCSKLAVSITRLPWVEARSTMSDMLFKNGGGIHGQLHVKRERER